MAGEESFVRVLRAVEPHLDTLVVAGAWANRLYDVHPLGRSRGFEPLMTEDADLAFPLRPPPAATSLSDLLRANGFRQELSGSEQVPVTSYVLGEEGHGFSVEFIAPLVGSPTKRDGTARRLIPIAGVTAHLIRYVELLSMEPWTLSLKSEHGFPVGSTPIQLRVANPVSYLAQKVLSLPERMPLAKRPKDVLYIHDTIQTFSDHLHDLHPLASKIIRDGLHPKTQRKFHELRQTIFDANLCTGAARIARESGRPSPPPPDRIRDTCRTGLEDVFGEG